MKNRIQPMKVGSARYTADELDMVDLEFQVGRPLILSEMIGSYGRKDAQHVSLGASGWIVFGEGNTRATAVKPTQAAAIKIATRIAGKKKSSVIIHQRNGKILEKVVSGQASKDFAHTK